MSKVISVVGAGHSGSTLLDCLIGSIPGAFSTGELTYLPWQIDRRRGGPPEVSQEEARVNEDVCSCLKSFRTCQAWGPVVRRLSDKVGFDIHQDPHRFKMAILRADEYIPPSKKHWKKLFLFRSPRLITSVAVQHRALRLIVDLAEARVRGPVRNNWLLFDTVGEVLGEQFVVDSSKDFLRFLMLHSHRPSDISMLFLIRDVRAIAFSHVKRGIDPVAAAKMWVRYHNRIMSVLRKNRDINCQIVLYERLADDPVWQRRRVAEFLNLPDPGNSIRIDTRERHLVAGNPIKYQGKITIRRDDAWRNELRSDLRGKVNKILEGLDGNLRELIGQAAAE